MPSSLLLNINWDGDRPRATLPVLTQIIAGKGVQKAYTLDGGQTATMIFNGTTFNRVDWDSERTMSDIVYFATAKDSGEGATP